MYEPCAFRHWSTTSELVYPEVEIRWRKQIKEKKDSIETQMKFEMRQSEIPRRIKIGEFGWEKVLLIGKMPCKIIVIPPVTRQTFVLTKWDTRDGNDRNDEKVLLPLAR